MTNRSKSGLFVVPTPKPRRHSLVTSPTRRDYAAVQPTKVLWFVNDRRARAVIFYHRAAKTQIREVSKKRIWTVDKGR